MRRLGGSPPEAAPEAPRAQAAGTVDIVGRPQRPRPAMVIRPPHHDAPVGQPRCDSIGQAVDDRLIDDVELLREGPFIKKAAVFIARTKNVILRAVQPEKSRRELIGPDRKSVV